MWRLRPGSALTPYRFDRYSPRMLARATARAPRSPNTFLVGAPRCGTTAMFRLLASHPDVSVSALKEPFYFCTDFHHESDRHHGRPMRFPVRAETDYLALFSESEL